jgi:hypothetical protein
MATINVTTTLDVVNAVDGVTSLREAIIEANANADLVDTINLVSGATYNLTILGAGEDAAATGDLDLLNPDSVTIQAIGAANATINAAPLGDDRIFDVLNAGATLSLNNLNLTGGNVSAAAEDGGAIDLVSGATLNVSASMITGNTANRDGGGIAGNNNNTVNITDESTIANNIANDDGGGIFLNDGGSLTVTDSSITGNTATTDEGGGIYMDDNNTFVFTDSVLNNNEAGDDGGGAFFDTNNNATIARSTISGNNATGDDGGGFYFDSNATISIVDSTISNNTANDDGAGLETDIATNLMISNSTFSGNTGGGVGGGISIEVAGSVANISNTTIAFNTATTNGGGIFVDGGATLNIDNTIVAMNESGGATDIDNNGIINSGGFNLIGDNTGTAGAFPAGVPNGNNDLVGTAADPIDPMLAALADNGGATETHALLLCSPAINGGDPGFVAPPANDQRGAGFDRVEAGRLDIGAFELQTSAGVNTFGNQLLGSFNDDTIVGSANNEIIIGNFGDDNLFGGDGTDNMSGDGGNDYLGGGTGNDFLDGGIGDDTLDGVCGLTGSGEIDRLAGGAGADLFILGASHGAYYGDFGILDYAYIPDFNPGVDTLQLNGVIGDYTFVPNTSVVFSNLNVTGQGIFRGGDGIVKQVDTTTPFLLY